MPSLTVSGFLQHTWFERHAQRNTISMKFVLQKKYKTIKIHIFEKKFFQSQPTDFGLDKSKQNKIAKPQVQKGTCGFFSKDFH